MKFSLITKALQFRNYFAASMELTGVFHDARLGEHHGVLRPCPGPDREFSHPKDAALSKLQKYQPTDQGTAVPLLARVLFV